jgi:Tetratricopeptide repeat
VVKAEVLGELRERERWLLVFDNAQTPADITGWLPGGGGHVLITSRERNWAEMAASVEVDVLARPESVAILQGRVSGLTEADADRLADELGDLPLAVVQGAGFIAETGTPATQYMELLHTQARRLLAEGAPESYPRPLAAATQLIAERLDREDPAAAQLASLCAFLAPEPIPLDWFTNATGAFSGRIAACAADPLAWAQLLRRIGHSSSSLGRIDEHSLQMHRLTQAILRDGFTPQQARTTREQAGEILAANNPGTADNFATWPDWARLVPHVLAVHPDAPMHGANLRDLACGASWYLLRRGDTRSSYELSRDLRAQWLDRLGGDDQDTLRASTRLAAALRAMERYQEARELDEDTLAGRRRLWGEDDPDTLISAGCLAGDLRGLGKVGAALELNQHNLARRRAALGDDNPDTLGSATCVARDLAASGRVQEAKELNEDTLARRRRVLGYDDLSTLLSARSLVANLRALGEEQAAEDLDRDTRARLQRVAKGIDPDRIQEHEPEDVRRRP